MTSHDLRYKTYSDNIRSEGQLRGNVRPKTGPSSRYRHSYCDSEDVKTSHPKQIKDYTRTMISTVSIVKPPSCPCSSLMNNKNTLHSNLERPRLFFFGKLRIRRIRRYFVSRRFLDL